MKYIKGTAPFAIKDGKKTLIQTYHQSKEEGLKGNSYTNALMVVETQSDKMVLVSDAKCLLPLPSRGAILDRSHNINLAGIEELVIHPEIFDKLVADGILDQGGNLVTAEKKAAPAPAPAPEPAEAPRAEPEADPASNPADVNGDGVVDAQDVAEVATAAAEADAIDKLTPAKLRKKYEEVFGKKAPSNWKDATVAKKIKESLK